MRFSADSMRGCAAVLRRSAGSYGDMLGWLVGGLLRRHRMGAVRIVVWSLVGLGLRAVALAIPVALAHWYAEGKTIQVAGFALPIHPEGSGILLWMAVVVLAGIASGWCQIRMVQQAVETASRWVAETLESGLGALSAHSDAALPKELREAGDGAVWSACVGGTGRLFLAARMVLVTFLPMATVVVGFGLMCLISFRLTLVVAALSLFILIPTLLVARTLARKARPGRGINHAMRQLVNTVLDHRVCVGSGMPLHSGRIQGHIAEALAPSAAFQQQREISRSISDVGMYLGGAALVLIVLYGVQQRADWASWSLLLGFLLAMQQAMAALKQVMTNLVAINISYPSLRIFYKLLHGDPARPPATAYRWAETVSGPVSHPPPLRGGAIGITVCGGSGTPRLPEIYVDLALSRSDGHQLSCLRLPSDVEMARLGLAPGTVPALDASRFDCVFVPSGPGTSVLVPDAGRPLVLHGVSLKEGAKVPEVDLVAVVVSRKLQAVLTRDEFIARIPEFRAAARSADNWQAADEEPDAD